MPSQEEQWTPDVKVKVAKIRESLNLENEETELNVFMALYQGSANDPQHMFALSIVKQCLDKHESVIKRILVLALEKAASNGKFANSAS